MKKIIVTIEWGDEYPAVHFFEAESWEELECSQAYQDIISSYPDGLEMTVYPDVPDKTFNDMLNEAKGLQKYIDKRNKDKMKAFEKTIQKMEKEGTKIIFADWNDERVYGIKDRTFRINKR